MPRVSKATRSASQLRLKFFGDRKDTDTVAQRRAESLEHERYAPILDELAKHPMVREAWRVNTKSGWFVPVNGAWPHDRHFVRIGKKGAPDISGLLYPPPGERRDVALFLEVKREGEKPDEDQIRFLSKVASGGSCAGVIHNAPEAVELINRFYASCA